MNTRTKATRSSGAFYLSNGRGILHANARALRFGALALVAVAMLLLGARYHYRAEPPSTPPPQSSSHNEQPATISTPPKRPAADSSPPERNLPSEYFDVSKDQQRCEEYYGEQYLRQIASRGHPYCSEGSKSSLVCFQGKNMQTATRSATDPLCVARGARIIPQGKDKPPEFAMHCDLRNFEEEKTMNDEAAEELRGVQDIRDMGPYYYETGAGAQLINWETDTKKAGCSAGDNGGKWVLLARREKNTNTWHKLAEIWQAMLSVQALWLANDPATGKPMLEKKELKDIQVVFENDRAEPLDDLWTIVTGNKPTKHTEYKSETCLGNVILPLAGSSSPFWSFLEEKFDHEVCRTRTLIDYFVRRVFDFYSIKPRPEVDISSEPVVTIIDSVYNRVWVDIEKKIDMLQQRNPTVTLRRVDFSVLPLKAQIEYTQLTDVLVGQHGGAMANTLFMPPGTAVVEILPPPGSTLGFRHIAKMRGLGHFIGHALYEEEWQQSVHNKTLPEGWVRPESDPEWQDRPKTFVLDDDFVGLIEAAIRSQQFKSARLYD